MQKLQIEKKNQKQRSLSDNNFSQPLIKRTTPLNTLPIDQTLQQEVDPFK